MPITVPSRTTATKTMATRTTPARSMRRVAFAAIAVACAFAGSPLVKSAEAGAYVVAQCDWKRTGAHSARYERTSTHYRGDFSCRQGSKGLQIGHSGRGTKDGRLGAWSWRAPSGTALRGVTLDSHLRGAGGHAAQLVVGRSDGTADYFGRAENRWLLEHWSGVNGRWFRVRLRCYGGGDRICADVTTPHAWVKRLRFTLEDAAAPSLSVGGSLLAGGARRGTQALDARIADAGGGARRVTVAVNGVPAASRTFGCALKWGMGLRASPCPGTAGARVALDTSRAPFRDGDNLVETCAEDLAMAGAPNRDCVTRSVLVENVCPASPARASGLTARFRAGRRAITVRHGSRARVLGTLRDGAGRPVAGATACVLQRYSTPSARWRRAAILRSNRFGRIAWSPRQGGSRAIRIVHRYGSGLIERRLRLRVRAVARLTVRPRAVGASGRIRFRGSLPGPARGGRIVVLQVRDRGRWRGFRAVRTGRRGRFRAAYRFRRTTRPTVYVFRALTRGQAGYPYARGVSRRVSVRVG